VRAQAPREWQVIGDVAENYERYFVPAIFRPWAEDVLETAAVETGEHVLDVACATGIVARMASELVGTAGSVVGLDINPAMLAVAARATAKGAPIEWRQANAEDMPFEDGTFDLVICQQGLQFFPNKPVALNEMRRVLRREGRLVASVWRNIQHIPGYLALAEALEHHVSPESASFMYMTGSLAEELGGLTGQGGFKDGAVRTLSREIHWPSVEAFVWEMIQATPLGWMTSINQADDSTRTKVIDEVSARLEPYTSDDGLAFPIEACVVTARK
jgi:ubiquinone/menaquinone biosynthesis C-methylase UbiE